MQKISHAIKNACFDGATFRKEIQITDISSIFGRTILKVNKELIIIVISKKLAYDISLHELLLGENIDEYKTVVFGSTTRPVSYKNKRPFVVKLQNAIVVTDKNTIYKKITFCIKQ